MRTRWIAIFALAAMLALLFASALAIPARPAEFAWVVDETGTLSQQDKDEILAYGEALLEATGGQPDGDQLVALIVEFLDGMDPADYVTQVINTWGLGDNSLLILLATGDRAIEIGAGRGIDRLFSAAQRGALIDEHLDAFADDRFAEGMIALYQDLAERTAQLRGKTLSLSNTYAQGTPSKEQVQEENEAGKGGAVRWIVLIMLILAIPLIVKSRSGTTPRRRRSYSGTSRVPSAPSSPPRRTDWRTAPPPPPSPRRSSSGSSMRTFGRAAAGGLLDAVVRSTKTRSSGGSSWSSSGRSSSSFGSSGRSSSSRSSGSFRNGGSRGSSAGRRF